MCEMKWKKASEGEKWRLFLVSFSSSLSHSNHSHAPVNIKNIMNVIMI